MRTDLVITTEPIDEAALLAERKLTSHAGAVVTFQGVVRPLEGTQEIAGIEYEAFEEMARHQFRLLFREIEKRWPIHSLRVVHRIGFVAANLPSLWVELTASHRREALAACEYLIDHMKLRVPIWKHPRPAGGPGAAAPTKTGSAKG